VCLEFEKPTTRQQQEWLLATRVPLRSITFHPDDQVGTSRLSYAWPASVLEDRDAPAAAERLCELWPTVSVQCDLCRRWSAVKQLQHEFERSSPAPVRR